MGGLAWHYYTVGLMSVVSRDRNVVIIASRKSRLALEQSELVMRMLQGAHPELQFVIETFSTKGDRILDVSLNKIGDKGLFTKELEVALLEDRADIAIHSLKDMPSELPDGLTIGAITEREDPSDAVVLHSKHQGRALSELPEGSLIGTSSLRRVAQLQRQFPQFRFKSVRGNLQTRLEKLDDYETFGYDAIILASAGLIRMGLSERISEKLPENICLPAVGQGALAVECRENDERIMNLIGSVNHTSTEIRCRAERAFMKEMQGGCQVPIGVFTQLIETEGASDLELRAIILNLDGSRALEGHSNTQEITIAAAENLGRNLGVELKGKGAAEILNEIFFPRDSEEVTTIAN